MKNHTLVFVGPSGIGKTYAAQLLLSTYPLQCSETKIYTTRKPRKSESRPDKISVTDADFTSMIKQNRFVIHGTYGGNLYGFTPEELFQRTPLTLTTTWSKTIPKFAQLDSVVLIGMQPPSDWESLLIERMQRRGETEEIISKRLAHIEKDISFLKEYKNLIKEKGCYFSVDGDDSVTRKILPWIQERFDLQTE